MMKVLYIPGLRFKGESDEQAEAREAEMKAHNERVDALWKDWARQRALPMPSMREWAAKRGVGPTAAGREQKAEVAA